MRKKNDRQNLYTPAAMATKQKLYVIHNFQFLSNNRFTYKFIFFCEGGGGGQKL